MKKIVINADDFGMTEAVTLGIISGHRDGIISSTSLMVNMLYAKEAVKLAEGYSELGLGIHLNVTIGKPILNSKEVKSLVSDDGNFHKAKDYNDNLVKIDEEELFNEFKAQINKFIEYAGKKPDHIDCHHKYDFFGLYPRITEYLIKTYNVPMRLEQKHKDYKYPLAKKDEIMIISDVDEDTLCEYLKKYAVDDLIELPNHSGFVDYDLMKISSLNVGRTKDLQICKSKKLKQLLSKKGYEIVNWSKIV